MNNKAIQLVIIFTFICSFFYSQEKKTWKQSFGADATNWISHKEDMGKIEMKNDRIFVSNSNYGMNNIMPTGVNIDFSKDFEITFNVKWAEGSPLLTFFFNASANGVDRYNVVLGFDDYSVEKWKNDNDRTLAKEKKLKFYKYKNPFTLTIKRVADKFNLQLTQDGNMQDLGSYKFEVEENFTTIGIKYFTAEGKTKGFEILGCTATYFEYLPAGTNR